MTDNYKQIAIEKLFRYGLRLDKTILYGNGDKCEIDEDEMGEYFLFRFPGNDLCFYYEKYNALFGEWQARYRLQFAKFRLIKSGLGGENRSYYTLMLYDNKYYIINGWVVYLRNDKPGPWGEPVFTFYNGEEKYNIKTEIALKKLLKKIDVRELWLSMIL